MGVAILKKPAQLPTSWDEVADLTVKNPVISVNSAFESDPARQTEFSCRAAGLNIDYSRHRIDARILKQLLALANQAQLHDKVAALMGGAIANPTENRAALHTSLRNYSDPTVPYSAEITASQQQLSALTDKLNTRQLAGAGGQPITDVVNIGIGGSDLGPRMVNEALSPYRQAGAVNVHFVSNIDPSDIADTLSNLNPATTLFALASKSFSTQETLENGNYAKQWLSAAGIDRADQKKHFLGITCNAAAAVDYGIDQSMVLPLWPWVGGRYSLWSTIGLPIALANGADTYQRLLAGAAAMDKHFREAPLTENAPVIMALLEILYVNFYGSQSMAVIPYDQRLNNFPTYLQQLTMESNGKSCDLQGRSIGYATCPSVWGCSGTNGQHSFHQLFHQGTQLIPVDFILPLKSHNDVNNQHQKLVANCLSQSVAMTQGKSLQTATDELLQQGLSPQQAAELAAHKVIEGNKPNTIISFEQTTPEILGALIALYEHKVFTQSVIWNINAFDQWGVELGKQIGKQVDQALSGTDQAPAIIASYIESFRSVNNPGN